MKGIFPEKYGGRKDVGSIESDGYPVSLRKDDTESAETCTNVRKCAQTSGNAHKCATSAMRPPNFAVKNKAHGTETNRKEGGTSMGGENRE